jgi:hypothetical protein
MNKRFSNLIKFVSFSVSHDNKLSFLTYPTNDFTRIDATKLSNNIKDVGLDKVLLVFITDYYIPSNFIRISDNLAITTISFHEFLEDSTSINLLYSYKDKNIIFIFKDLKWLDVVTKFKNRGRSLPICDMESSIANISTFVKHLNCMDGLIGFSILEKLDDEDSFSYVKLEGCDRIVPENEDLSTESILTFDSNKSTIIYTNIDREIDDFLN